MAFKKVSKIGSRCVACGTCVRQCRLGAISIYKGITAKVDADKCVGCGKCESVCPAGVIEMVAREVPDAEALV